MTDKNAIVKKLYVYNYWFCNEMLKDEKACKEAEGKENAIMTISGAPGNVACMKGCMEDTVQIINFLRNKENSIEPWQLAGAEAVLNKCIEDDVVPFDLPGTLMALFGMWDELEKRLRS